MINVKRLSGPYYGVYGSDNFVRDIVHHQIKMFSFKHFTVPVELKLFVVDTYGLSAHMQ